MAANTYEVGVRTGVAPWPVGLILFVVFLVLKLTGVITWSWLWVTAPLWIPLALAFAVLLVGAFIAGIVELFTRGAKR